MGLQLVVGRELVTRAERFENYIGNILAGFTMEMHGDGVNLKKGTRRIHQKTYHYTIESHHHA